MSFNLYGLLDHQDLKKQPLELKKICERIFSRGKGIRSRLVCLVADGLGLQKKEQLFLSRIIEYIHNSSLLHDDFIDHSKVRRSRKTAWLEFSPSQAVLAGDYLLAKVNIYLAREKNLKLVEKTAEVICQLAEGEFLQKNLIPFGGIKDKGQRDKVSELKTASLFKWCLQAPFIYKKRRNPLLYKHLDHIACSMGLLFQRSDDLMDFAVRNKDKKPYLCDIKQKYFNSFACFLLKGTGFQKKEQLKGLRSLFAVRQLFPDFEKKVQAFDCINSKIIKKTEKNLKKLQGFLKGKEQELIPSLEKWIPLFYWR